MLRARAAAGRAVAILSAAAAACALAVTAAVPAGADAVRNQEQWVLNMVNAPAAWATSTGRGVTVAVIDSGVYGSIPDLSGSVTNGPDYSGVSTSRSNASWGVHGTWMASLIAGHGHGPGGASGIIGVAPGARILSIRVVTDRGDPHIKQYEHESNATVQTALAKAITYAAGHGAKVISMSLGYGAASWQVRLALQNALDKGIVVVASSGNSGDTARARRGQPAPYSFPADYPGVLGVGALAQNGSAAGFSSDNLSVEVAAPGVKVPAQGRDGQYWLVSGTSPACALTAGVAALIKAVYPGLAPALVEQAITSSTRNPPAGGYDDRVGFGTVDAAAALAAAARLKGDRPDGRGTKVSAHFGGGPAAITGVPVPARGRGRLALYALLALVCLVTAGVAAVLLLRAPRARRQRAQAWQDDGQPWPDQPRRRHAAHGMPPAPAGWPEPPAQAGWPGQPAPDGWLGPPAPAGWPDPPVPARQPDLPAPAGRPGPPAPAG